MRAPSHGRTLIIKGPTLRCDTEEAVFAAVGVPYREPRDRNCEPVEVKCSFGPVPRRPLPVAFSAAAAAADDEEEDAVLLELQVWRSEGRVLEVRG